MITVNGIKLPFNYVCGSEVWPSTNPNDSPFSKFICELCGGEITFKEFGEFPMGTLPDNGLNRVMWHYDHCPEGRGKR